MLGCGVGEVFAGEWGCGGLRGHHGWGFAACGEVSAASDRELDGAIGEGGFGAGGSALGEAGVDGGFRAGVGEEQMLDDLLDVSRITRGILDQLDRAGIRVASSTVDVVGVPPLCMERRTGRRPEHSSLALGKDE